MTPCNSRCSIWTLIFVGLLFAAFIGGTQLPIQFSIGKRAEYVPVALVPDQLITSAGFATPAVPTSYPVAVPVSYPVSDVTPPAVTPVAETPAVHAMPTSIPPVQEPNVPSMPPVMTPPTPIPPPPEITFTPPITASPPSTPPILQTPEPPMLEEKHAVESYFTHAIEMNLQKLATMQSQKTAVEKEIAAITTTLKQRLDRAHEELDDVGDPSNTLPKPQLPLADKSIDQLVDQVKHLKASNAKLDRLIMGRKQVLRTQFDELQKQAKEMGIMDVDPLPKKPVPPPM